MNKPSKENQENPFSPPETNEPAPFGPVVSEQLKPVALPPAAPKVFGVLSIIFASLVIFGSLVDGCMNIVGRKSSSYMTLMTQGRSNPKAVEEAYRTYHEVTYPGILISTLTYIVFSGVLLFVGIGQVKYRRWACKWSVYWGISALISLAITTAISFLLVKPATTQLMNALKKAAPSNSVDAQVNALVGSFSSSPAIALLGIVFYLPYPLLLIYFFTRPHIKKAMLK